MTKSVGIKALAIEMPKGVRTNQYWRNRHPEMIADLTERKKGRMFSEKAESKDDFELEMAGYLADPFKGTVERRVLTPGESSLTLELSAARKALAAAKLSAREIDLVIVASFLPDYFGCMNAPYLARELGAGGLAFNLESACAGALVGVQTACGLVSAGQFTNAMVVVSCTYSRDTDPKDVIALTSGDGAAAFVIGEVDQGLGRLGGYGMHTGQTCGALWFENYARDDGSLWFRLQASPDAGKILQGTATECLHRCVHGALNDAGVSLGDIDAFVFNTPFAWYAKFCARSLGVDPALTISPYAQYANMGPALMPVNLYHMARERPLKRGDLVLAYSIGSISSAGAVVMRWSDAALGPPPDKPELVCD
jgi:3-oxoacyl-[acyl-carrier-protein] synthase III